MKNTSNHSTMEPDQPELGQIVYLRRNKLDPDPDQPRKDFSDKSVKDHIAGIRDSIRANKIMGRGLGASGIFKPLLVRLAPGALDENGKIRADARFILLDGECRYWGTEDLLDELPCIIEDVSADDAYEIAVMLVLLQKDLNPIEEALALKAIQNKRKLSVRGLEEHLKATGRGRGYIQNRLGLLSMGSDVLGLITRKHDSLDVAKAIDKVKDPDRRSDLIMAYEKKILGHEEVVAQAKAAASTGNVARKTSFKPEATQSKSFQRPVLTVLKGGVADTQPNFGPAPAARIDLGIDPLEYIRSGARQLDYVTEKLDVYAANEQPVPRNIRRRVQTGLAELRQAIERLEAKISGLKDDDDYIESATTGT